MAQILVVEDDTFISLFLDRKLKEYGHIVYTATSTKEADEVLERQKEIDIVLLDVILPDESGFEFLERIKKENKLEDIPVLILSNLGQEHEIERGKELGALDFLVKGNFSPNEIVDKVNAILKEQGKG